MSTLKVNDIQEATAGGGKIWPLRALVNFNGSNTSIRADGNVSSLTDNGTGDFTTNFSNSFSSAGYTVTSAYTDEVASYHTACFIPYVYNSPHVYTSSACRVRFHNVANSGQVADKYISALTFAIGS